MSACRVHLGQTHPKRRVCRRVVSIHGIWHYQSYPRNHYNGSAHASALAATVASAKETPYHRNVQFGCSVRLLPSPKLKHDNDLTLPRLLISICIVSLQRVIWLRQWDQSDLAFDAILGVCWSILEPSLGVINACLPVMWPVLQKLFRRPSLTSHTTGSRSRLRWFGRFTRAQNLNHESIGTIHPISNVPPCLLTSISSAHGRSKYHPIGRDNNGGAGEGSFWNCEIPADSIQVTRDWEVLSIRSSQH